MSAVDVRHEGAGADARANAPFLELQELTKAFGDVVAVQGLDISLAPGEFFSLLGPSGCGKTTALRMIAGFERPDTGRVLLEGREITADPPNKRPINTVFQSYALFSHLNVAGNVGFGLREERVPKGERIERVREGLRLVQLEGLEARRTNELSGGQQQRVALARAVVKQPRVLLLDEPLGALDLKLRKAMQIELKAIQERLGITFVYVTHDQEEALTMSDRIAVMREGRVCQIGPPEEIYDRPASRYVADFIGAANTLPCEVVGEDGSAYAVEHQGVKVRAAGPAGLEAGRSAFLIVRPERCELAPVESSGQRGTVAEVLFKGLYHSYLVALPDGSTVTAAQPHRPGGSRSWSVGDEVEVRWEDDEAWVVGE